MHRIKIAVVTAVVAVLASLAIAAPAVAHDELQSSSPSSGEDVAEAPAEITLSFSAEVLTMGAALIVVDSSGHDWVLGEPTVDEATVSAALDPEMPAAGYEIRWRVVSGDGHPISGLIPFTVDGAEPFVRESDPDAEAEDTATSVENTATEVQSTQQTQSGTRIALVAAGGAVAAAAVFVSIHLIRGRTKNARSGNSDD
ncbi:copper resistance CopC family protein [Microbacterium sp. NPDC076911]|uniref:copper resistance CopC family protein n=1 Tax=Microbacterium sp. NPDC076911 TaxID=3154958 RepID=UPI003432E9B9